MYAYIHDLIQYAAENGQDPVTLVKCYLYFRRGRWPSEAKANRMIAEVETMYRDQPITS